MRRRVVSGLALTVWAFCVALAFVRPAAAQDLERAFLLPELFEIMALEGRSSILADGSLPVQGRALAQFSEDVAQIYAPERMMADFVTALEQLLEPMPETRADAIAFALTDLGREIMQLEITAREALLDDEVDAFARSLLDQARATDGDAPAARRLADIRQRIEANDLIELNVSLGLNTSFAYYRGMMMENAVSGMTSDMLLELVWAQEPDIRADIEDWIESYFLMAYQPLAPESMEVFLAYVETPLAQAFNRAMFQAFDTVFSEISLQVGRALGRVLSEQEL